jgi:hypothetical protein
VVNSIDDVGEVEEAQAGYLFVGDCPNDGVVNRQEYRCSDWNLLKSEFSWRCSNR